MQAGNFPIDLVLFGLVAAFLVLRLRSVLGRRNGLEPPQPMPGLRLMPRNGMPVLEQRGEPPRPIRPLPDPSTPAGRGLDRIRAADRNFDAARFLAGAENAFRLILSTYAKGDRVGLRALVTDDTYRVFETSIAAREAAGETQRTELRRVAEIVITEAGVQDRRGEIGVRIVSDQISVTLDRDGKPVAGVDAVTEIVDAWSFERDLSGNDPAWRLAAAQSG